MKFDKRELYRDLKSSRDLSDRLKTFLPLIKQSNDAIKANPDTLLHSVSDYSVEPLCNPSIDLVEDERITMDIQMGVFDVNDDIEKKLVSMNDITVVHLEDTAELKENMDPLITEISSEQFET